MIYSYSLEVGGRSLALLFVKMRTFDMLKAKKENDSLILFLLISICNDRSDSVMGPGDDLNNWFNPFVDSFKFEPEIIFKSNESLRN